MSRRKRPDPFPARVSRSEPGTVGVIDPWELLRWRVKEGEYPTDFDLADAIRRRPDIPPDMARYIGERLARTVTRPPGRRGATQAERAGEYFRALFLHSEVESMAAQYRREARPRAKATALADVAKRHNLSSDTLRDLIRDALDADTRSDVSRRAREGGETPQ